MLMAGTWSQNQRNKIHFVLVNPQGDEVSGLGVGWMIYVGDEFAGFSVGQGRKFELGYGHYGYEATEQEASRVGPISIVIQHQDILQQNMEYVVETRAFLANPFTYTLLDETNGQPISGAFVLITTDISGTYVVWTGQTDAFGVARQNGQLPLLDPGTYYVWRSHPEYTFDDPDTEVVA